MAYCTICGSQLEPNAKFCVICGAKLASAPAETPTQPAQPAAPAQPDETQAPPQATYPPVSGAYQTPPPPQQPSYSPVPQQPFNGQQQTPPTAEGYDPQDIQDNRIMAVLAYIGWLILIPLFARRDSPFTRFHCNQGLVLALAWLGIFVLRGILVGSLGLPLSFLFFLLSMAVVVFSVIGIVNAVQGQAKELPLIGSLRILK
ncbi:MAG: zinc ribbon domain-containing protein [Clostridia bacterium]|nr:zinc ribbon domain-containing protein [Clostridia bacterium]